MRTRLPEGREWAVAVMIVLLFFSLGGAYGCLANMPNDPDSPEAADTDMTPVLNGEIRRYAMPDTSVCYVLYNQDVPRSMSCLPIN